MTQKQIESLKAFNALLEEFYFELRKKEQVHYSNKVFFIIQKYRDLLEDMDVNNELL